MTHTIRPRSLSPYAPGVANRLALTALFVVDGVVFASWMSRLPQVQQAIGAAEGGLGVALIGTALGAFTAMPLVGMWCRNHAPAPVALLAGLALCGSLLLPGLAASPWALLGLLIVFGAAYGAVDVSMNSAAVRVATELDRPVLPAFHAGFSAGNVLGAGVGALLAAWGVPVEAHLIVVGLLGALVLLGCGSGLRTRNGALAGERGSGGSLRGRLPLVLAAASLTFAAAFGEGTIANWSGIHLREQAEASPGLLPLGYAVFALFQVLGRAFGTRLTARFGVRAMVLGGILLGLAGGLLVLAPSAWVMLVGYAIAGIGLSCLFPLGIARAGELAGSSGVAVASTLGYGGVLLGPPVIGMLAAGVTLPLALLLPPLLLFGCLFTMRAATR